MSFQAVGQVPRLVRRSLGEGGSGPAVPAEITFAELGKIAYGNQAMLPKGFEGGLESTYYHSHPHADPLMLPDLQGRVRAQYTFSSAAHAAVVEVDRETGRVRVLRYVIVSDNGTLINPAVVDGQIYGSAAHGISVALGEGFVYGADGQLQTLTLLDYGKSTTLETPHIEIEHHPVPDPFTTLGQKAAGEGAAIPSPAAIASAVEDALTPLGVRVRTLPLSPERVWNLINRGSEAESDKSKCKMQNAKLQRENRHSATSRQAGGRKRDRRCARRSLPCRLGTSRWPPSP